MLRWVSNWDELVAASRAYRPEVWKHKEDRIRRHAAKPDEVLADAIGAVLLGEQPLSLLKPLMGKNRLTEYDLGLKDAPLKSATPGAPAPASEEAVQTAVLPRLRAHQRPYVEAETRGGRAVALPTDLPALVDQNRPQPRVGQHRCGPNAGGPAADNDDPRQGRSSLGGCDVQTDIAGAASVVQARTRRPSPIQTQQS